MNDMVSSRKTGGLAWSVTLESVTGGKGHRVRAQGMVRERVEVRWANEATTSLEDGQIRQWTVLKDVHLKSEKRVQICDSCARALQ
jgi:hypothetical protein